MSCQREFVSSVRMERCILDVQFWEDGDHSYDESSDDNVDGEE